MLEQLNLKIRILEIENSKLEEKINKLTQLQQLNISKIERLKKQINIEVGKELTPSNQEQLSKMSLF